MDIGELNVLYWKERYNIERGEVVALGKRVKELEEGIEKHKQEINTYHPADIELHKLVEKG